MLFTERLKHVIVVVPDVRPVHLHKLVIARDDCQFGHLRNLFLEAERVNGLETGGGRWIITLIAQANIHVRFEREAEALVRHHHLLTWYFFTSCGGDASLRLSLPSRHIR